MSINLIQNNIKECILFMAREGCYDIKSFNYITTAYSYAPCGDYNLIFDFPAANFNPNDFQQALAYSAAKQYPFMLVRDNANHNALIDPILQQYNYQQIGISTRMLITHADHTFADADRNMIKRVSTPQMLDIFCDITDEAFSKDPGSTMSFMSLMKNLLDPHFDLHLYLAYEQGEPVASSMLYLPPDRNLLAGHYGWGTRIAVRKKGIMTQFVKNLILISKELGYSASVAQCYDASVRMAERMGFQKFGALDLYLN